MRSAHAMRLDKTNGTMRAAKNGLFFLSCACEQIERAIIDAMVMLTQVTCCLGVGNSVSVTRLTLMVRLHNSCGSSRSSGMHEFQIFRLVKVVVRGFGAGKNLPAHETGMHEEAALVPRKAHYTAGKI